MNDNPSLTVSPIGIIRTQMHTKFDSPHQPKNATDEKNVIELFPDSGFEIALRDLASFDRIWLIWWFHKNPNWRPTVLPPRGPAKKRGVFATRSPHRPNPLGITSVPLLGIEGLKVFVGNTDLVDGTPILDIKPYIASVDSFPEASLGWLADIEEFYRQEPEYTVTLAPLAEEQLSWLKNTWSVDFLTRATELLARDPSVHRTRRIKRLSDAQFIMGCGAWRIIFSLQDTLVYIECMKPGYPEPMLLSGKNNKIPDQEAQLAFLKIWPDLAHPVKSTSY